MDLHIANVIFEITFFCQAKCAHCLKSVHDVSAIRSDRYRTPYAQVLRFLDEQRAFQREVPDVDLKISGGEPTIWREGSRDIVDVLLAASERGLRFSLVSNGLRFLDPAFCEHFFTAYTRDPRARRFRLYFTIDRWHQNYEGDRAEFLDRVLEARRGDPRRLELVDVLVQSVWSRRAEHNLSPAFLRRYSDQDVDILLRPLLPWGGGAEFDVDVPTLALVGNDKQSLGDFLPVVYKKGLGVMWHDLDEFLEFPNAEVFSAWGDCGKSIEYRNGKYHYCIAYSGTDTDDELICRLGEFSLATLRDYVAANPAIACAIADKARWMAERSAEAEDGARFALGYGICDICQRLCTRSSSREVGTHDVALLTLSR